MSADEQDAEKLAKLNARRMKGGATDANARQRGNW
jgi:hypothetical protein